MCETADDGNTEYSCPLILETSAVVFEIQRETGETGGGGKKGKVGSRFAWKMIRTEFRSERKPTRKGVDSVKTDRPSPTRPNANMGESRPSRKPIGRDRSGKKLIRLNRRLDRSRPVNTRKRKPTETETDRSNPAWKGANLVKNDQPNPIPPNTNPIKS